MTSEVFWILPILKSQRQKTFKEGFLVIFLWNFPLARFSLFFFAKGYKDSRCMTLVKRSKKKKKVTPVDRKLHGCIIFNLVYEKGVHNLSVNKIQLEGRSISSQRGFRWHATLLVFLLFFSLARKRCKFSPSTFFHPFLSFELHFRGGGRSFFLSFFWISNAPVNFHGYEVSSVNTFS